MAVTTSFDVHPRPYSGYANPSLPIASYIAQGTEVGNGTGGSLFLQFLFQRAAARDVSELYNLEQFSIHVDEAADIGANLETLAMDHLFGQEPAILQRYSLLLDFAGVGLGNASQVRDQGALPLWLGRPQTGLDAGIRLEFVNTLLVNYSATIQGYIWGPRAVLAAGGPQRPPQGYFRA